MNLDLDSIYRNFSKLFDRLTSHDRILSLLIRQFLNIQNLCKVQIYNRTIYINFTQFL